MLGLQMFGAPLTGVVGCLVFQEGRMIGKLNQLQGFLGFYIGRRTQRRIDWCGRVARMGCSLLGLSTFFMNRVVGFLFQPKPFGNRGFSQRCASLFRKLHGGRF